MTVFQTVSVDVEIDFHENLEMLDFVEKAMKNTLGKEFPDVVLSGCKKAYEMITHANKIQDLHGLAAIKYEADAGVEDKCIVDYLRTYAEDRCYPTLYVGNVFYIICEG